MSKQLINDFTTGSVPKQLIKFASPLFLSNLLQVAYNMVDMIIVGQANGKVGISAVSVGGDVSNFLTFIAMGFSSAGQVIISQLLGANQKEKIGKFIGTMFSFLLSLALILSIICFYFRTPIMHLMNTPPQAWNEAMNYASICIAGMVAIYGYNIISAVLRGLGDSKHPFVFVSLAAILNVILDLVFVLGLDMGASGAALATVISQFVSFASCGIFIWRKRQTLGFEISLRNFAKWDFPLLGTLAKLGIPMAIKSAAIHFSKLFVNSWINSYGVAVSALAGIANKLSSISNLISNSVNAAGASMVGQNVGAEKYDRVPKIMLYSFAFTLIISILLSAAILIFPDQIFSIFTDEADVLKLVPEYIPIAILMFFGSAFRTPANAMINGCGNYKVNFAMALFDGMILRIGLSVLFGIWLSYGYLGFWLGDALAGFT
ncbi:MAG: MATE family efflux transporter, partial [Clostridia bacterium]|nr:MATE family efflux transporter [Clostridia bacterium]